MIKLHRLEPPHALLSINPQFVATIESMPDGWTQITMNYGRDYWVRESFEVVSAAVEGGCATCKDKGKPKVTPGEVAAHRKRAKKRFETRKAKPVAPKE